MGRANLKLETFRDVVTKYDAQVSFDGVKFKNLINEQEDLQRASVQNLTLPIGKRSIRVRAHN